EEHGRVQGLEEPAREDRDADLGRVRLAARALVGAGHEGLDRVATLGVRRDAAVAVRACAVVARGKFPGGVGLPGLEEGIVDWRAGAVEHLPGERDALAPAG